MGGNPTRFVLFARSVDFKTEGEAREGGMKTRSGGEEGGGQCVLYIYTCR